MIPPRHLICKYAIQGIQCVWLHLFATDRIMEKTGWFIHFKGGKQDCGRLYAFHTEDEGVANRLATILQSTQYPERGKNFSPVFLVVAASDLSDDEWIGAVTTIRNLQEQAKGRRFHTPEDDSELTWYIECRSFLEQLNETNGEPVSPCAQVIELSPAWGQIDSFAADVDRLLEQNGACDEVESPDDELWTRKQIIDHLMKTWDTKIDPSSTFDKLRSRATVGASTKGGAGANYHYKRCEIKQIIEEAHSRTELNIARELQKMLDTRWTHGS